MNMQKVDQEIDARQDKIARWEEHPKDMHAEVEEYMRDWIGEPQDAIYLHEEIDEPEKRSDRYNEFIEYLVD